MTHNIKRKLADGCDVFGIYVGIPSPTIVSICKYAGYDFIRLDMEHSLFSNAEIRECLRTAQALDLPALVRVPSLSAISSILDMGAAGIIVPDIKTPADAMAAVEQVKYAPLGMRGMMPYSSVLRYGMDPLDSYIPVANDETALLIQLESVEAIQNIDAILQIDGIDFVGLGKQDYSQSVGYAGNASHPDVIDAEIMQIQKTIEYGKIPAPMVSSPNKMDHYRSIGVRCFTIGYDTNTLLDALRTHLEAYQHV